MVLVAGCMSSNHSPTGIGDPEPALSGTTIQGAAFDLKDHLGHPVVVNFWASWCTPCREEFPVIKDAELAHKGDGLVIVGVLFNDDRISAARFMKDFGADWPTLDDPGGTAAKAFRMVSPPQTYFIDANGILRGIQIGEMQAEDFARQYAAIAP